MTRPQHKVTVFQRGNATQTYKKRKQCELPNHMITQTAMLVLSMTITKRNVIFKNLPSSTITYHSSNAATHS